MNRLTALGYRLSVGLIGLLLAAIGAIAITYQAEVEPIRSAVDGWDAGAPARFAESAWWPPVLAALILLGLLWGGWLVARAIRPGRIDDLTLAGSDESGTLTLAPRLVAAAVADDLRGRTMFDDVSVTATDDRGVKLIRIRVTAPPHFSHEQVAAALAPELEQIREALDGSDIHLQALVCLEYPR